MSLPCTIILKTNTSPFPRYNSDHLPPIYYTPKPADSTSSWELKPGIQKIEPTSLRWKLVHTVKTSRRIIGYYELIDPDVGMVE